MISVKEVELFKNVFSQRFPDKNVNDVYWDFIKADGDQFTTDIYIDGSKLGTYYRSAYNEAEIYD